MNWIELALGGFSALSRRMVAAAFRVELCDAVSAAPMEFLSCFSAFRCVYVYLCFVIHLFRYYLYTQ